MVTLTFHPEGISSVTGAHPYPSITIRWSYGEFPGIVGIDGFDADYPGPIYGYAEGWLRKNRGGTSMPFTQGLDAQSSGGRSTDKGFIFFEFWGFSQENKEAVRSLSIGLAEYLRTLNVPLKTVGLNF